MGRFERSRKGRRDGFSNRDSSSSSFEEHQSSRRDSSRDSGRKFGRGSDRRRDRGNIEMTKVICSSCGVECEVPFKPTSTKPVYCDACFAKMGKGRSNNNNNNNSSRDLDIINEKLDKIMKALKIE